MAKVRGDNQAKILQFIRNEIQQKGYPPSVREICDGVGLRSTSTVHGHLMRLERKGLLRRDPTKPRAMELINDPLYSRREMSMVPLVGKVTAGTPILAIENVEETFPLPSDLLGDGEHFMLLVQGESMVKAGILDGDYVVVRKQQSAVNGEIVVAMIDDEATVKRFFKEDNNIRLQPENDFMDPILARDVTILGKVVTLIRRF